MKIHYRILIFSLVIFSYYFEVSKEAADTSVPNKKREAFISSISNQKKATDRSKLGELKRENRMTSNISKQAVEGVNEIAIEKVEAQNANIVINDFSVDFLKEGAAINSVADLEESEKLIYEDINLSPQDLGDVLFMQYEAKGFLYDHFSNEEGKDLNIQIDQSDPSYQQFVNDYTDSLLSFMSERDAMRVVKNVLKEIF